MKVTGTALLHAPAEQVWRAINDPAVLVRTIPGCERLEETGPDAYQMTVSAGVGGIRGTFAGTVRLSDQQPPGSLVLHASGAGAPGTVNATVQVTLEPDGDSTRLSYAADAVVGGPVGGVGQRVLGGVARKTAGEFFKAIDAVLAGTEPAPTAALPAPRAGQPVATETGGARVFQAPTPVRAAGGDGRSLLTAAAAGSALTLAAVLVGWLLGRSRH